MATPQEALQNAIENTSLGLFGNNTDALKLMVTYPPFMPELDSNLVVDLLILPAIEFKANEVIIVKKNDASLGVFTIDAPKKSIWLSDLIGVPREVLKDKISEVLDFVFTLPTMLKFQLITALPVDFTDSETVRINGLNSNMSLLHETLVNPIDESAVSALRNAIDLTTTEIIDNNTNVITIKNIYPEFGTQLPKTYVVDQLISFRTNLPMGSEIFIKKDGIAYKTVKTKKNIDTIWLSELIEESRTALYLEKSQLIELTFVYNQEINNKLVTGELQHFTTANLIQPNLSYGLFELANSNSFETLPLNLTNVDFLVNYIGYGSKIKEATLKLGNQQTLNIVYVTDNSANPPKTYMQVENIDEFYNIKINLLMDNEGVKNYISLLTDMARELRRLNEVV